MKFSIITPSYNMSDWLKLCVSSVADQKEVEFEHIVQDAGSSDGTVRWLEQDSRVRAFIEKDSGMYDAINRGLRRATGDILAYINCDEQYLPGALAKVGDFFKSNPDVDVVYGDVVLVDPQQEFLAYRKSVLPTRIVTRVHTLPVLTCATYFRRRLIDELNQFFDPESRAVGDKVWNLALVEAGCKMGLLCDFTSSFTATGDNLNFHEVAIREKEILMQSVPALYRALKPVMKGVHRLRKWKRGCYKQEPFDYSVYTPDSPEQRKTFWVKQPTFKFSTDAQMRNQS